jgi:glycosyltransferase involved in cell wall biosynthesis
MKVSVIIPSYKFVDYIEQSILSALCQKTNFDFEVLVRDDFSQDGSDKIIERLVPLYPNLKYYPAIENLGFHKNIPFLINESKGEYIAYLDGDDYFIDQNKLQKQVDFLDSNLDYSMHCTGYWMIRNDEYIPNDPLLNLCSPISEITTEDLFIENYVSFGRMFRNYKDLIKDYMFDLDYLDYPINYELSLRGKIKSENWPSGVYREHMRGVISSLPDDEKKIIHNNIRDYLKNKYKSTESKVLTIVDSFVHNKDVEVKLDSFIDLMNLNNQDVFLVSNSIVSPTILSKIKYHLYDSTNRLFNFNYTNVKPILLYHLNLNLDINDVILGMQRHGLSVLVNLFNSLVLAKSLGYTHFQHFETDGFYSDKSMEFIKKIPLICEKDVKKGLFFFNEDYSEKNISFHYFYCEIDYFLKIVNKISSEEDYKNYLWNKYGNYDFKNVEEYVYQNIMDNDLDNLLIKKTGQEQVEYFDGTVFNTETSISNISTKYEGASTRIYRVTEKNGDNILEMDTFAVVSYNYSEVPKTRTIKCYFSDGTNYELYQDVKFKTSWSYHVVQPNLEKIEVFEDGRFLYDEVNVDILPTILFK